MHTCLCACTTLIHKNIQILTRRSPCIPMSEPMV